MKTLKIISIVFIAFLLQACPGEQEKDPDNNLVLYNNSNEEIIIYYIMSSNTTNLIDFFPSPNGIVKKGDKKTISIDYNSFDNNRKFWVTVVKKSTLDAHTWQEIKDQGLYDKRYSFTLEELKAINFQIIYDGN